MDTWIDRIRTLFSEFDAEVGDWVKTKEISERGQTYLNELDRLPWKRGTFEPVPPDSLKIILKRVADELRAAVDEHLATGQLQPETVKALESFQAGDGGESSAFLQTIANPDSYSLRAVISWQFVIDDAVIRSADGKESRIPTGAHAQPTLNISSNPGGPVVEYLHALVAELRDLLDAGES